MAATSMSYMKTVLMLSTIPACLQAYNMTGSGTTIWQGRTRRTYITMLISSTATSKSLTQISLRLIFHCQSLSHTSMAGRMRWVHPKACFSVKAVLYFVILRYSAMWFTMNMPTASQAASTHLECFHTKVSLVRWMRHGLITSLAQLQMNRW